MMDLLVLSPHLDDVALSCGGTIAAVRRQGGRARVVTIFAGDDPRDCRSPLIDRLLEQWGLSRGEAVAARRVEDEEACKILDAEREHWDFLEAIYRRDADTGSARYEDIEDLFLADGSSIRELDLVEQLERRMAELPEASRVLAPLGVGGHVDHWLVQRAASSCFGENLSFYEEYPYSQWKRWAVWRATRPRRRWQSEITTLEPDDLAIRCRAIACYTSQIDALFGGLRQMERKVKRSVRRLGGERCWRPRDRKFLGRTVS